MKFTEFEQTIASLKDKFDSHEFIMLYVRIYTPSYLELLRKSGNVITADRQMGADLMRNKKRLGINKIGVVQTENIFGHETDCALWERNKPTINQKNTGII